MDELVGNMKVIPHKHKTYQIYRSCPDYIKANYRSENELIKVKCFVQILKTRNVNF